MKICIVLTTHNRKNSILHLLESLKTQDTRGIHLSIIVVVDGSSDGTTQAIQSLFPEVNIIEGDGTWWWTKSVNEGCKKGIQEGADAILLLNDDIHLDSMYFQQIRKAFEQEPLSIIGSLNITLEPEKKIYFSGAKKIQWWDGKLQRYHPFLTPYEMNLTGLHRSVVLPGRGLLIPTRIISSWGSSPLLDEKAFPQYKSDYDFVLRASKRNIPCLISWDAVLLVQVAETGKGAAFTRQSLLTFISSLFKKHSRSNLYRNFLFYIRHYPRWGLILFPVVALLIVIRQFYFFFKIKKY